MIINHRVYSIVDMPGLIEPDEDDSLIDSNKQEIDKAFVFRPNSIVAFIFGVGNGGRMSGEDTTAFRAISKAYSLKAESLLIIMNRVPKDCEPDYEASTLVFLKKILKINVNAINLCFLEKIDTKDEQQKQILRQRLLQFLALRVPMVHRKKHDIVLTADVVKNQQKEFTRLEKEFKATKDQYKDEISKNKDEMDRMRREMDRKVVEEAKKAAEKAAKEPQRTPTLGTIVDDVLVVLSGGRHSQGGYTTFPLPNSTPPISSGGGCFGVPMPSTFPTKRFF